MPVNTRAETIAAIERNAEAIRRLGATALYLFGSAARDELSPDSDIDVFIDCEPDGSFTFVEWFRMEELLEEELGREVEVATRRGLHPLLKSNIERSAIRII